MQVKPHLIQEFARVRNVRGLEPPQPGCLGLLWQLVELEVPLHRHVAAQVGELNLDQLLGVQRTVPVSGDNQDLSF